ncbi:MAG: hypothetical protein KF796_19565 [Ramlibacter sp.]|nr:hypothetical protein [Ramlibacter sp.]
MKTSDRITLWTLAIGVAACVGVYVLYPGAHWAWYVGIGLGTLIGIPKAIENAARDKVARQIVDQ